MRSIRPESSGMDVYLLMKQKDKMLEGGYELLGFNIKDTAVYPKYILKDKQGKRPESHHLRQRPRHRQTLSSGTIIDPRKGNAFATGKQFSKGTYDGVFTITLENHKKGGYNENFSYWSDGSQSSISKRGF